LKKKKRKYLKKGSPCMGGREIINKRIYREEEVG